MTVTARPALDFGAIQTAHFEREQAAKQWGSDRSLTVGASEIGQCARKTWFAKNSWDTDQVKKDTDEHGIENTDRWGARARGTVYETHWWEPALREGLPADSTLHLAGSEQRTLVREFLSATSDAVITGLDRTALANYGVADIGTDCIVVDCKTADPRTNLAEPKLENVYQIHVQIGLVRELTNFRPEYGVLTYTDASFWDEVKVFVVKFDPEIYAEAHRRATQIMTATAPTALRAEGVIAGGKECDWCLYTQVCGRTRHDAVPTKDHDNDRVDAATGAEIVALARLVKEAAGEEARQATRAAEFKDRIKQLLQQAGTRKYWADGISVSWAALKGRPAIDMASFKKDAMAAGLDPDAYSTVGAPTDRLTITKTDKGQIK